MYTIEQLNSKQFVDVPASTPAINYELDRVGITNRPHYIRVLDPFTGEEATLLADVSVSFNLPATQRGLHMSRIEAVLQNAKPDKLEDFVKKLAIEMSEKQGQADCMVRVTANYEKLVSKNNSGRSSHELIELYARAKKKGQKIETTLGVTVPFINACPCAQRWAKRDFATKLQKMGKSDQEISQLIEAAPLQSHTNGGKAKLQIESDVVSLPEIYGVLKNSVPIIRELLSGADEHQVVAEAHGQASFCEDNIRAIVSNCAKLSELPPETLIDIDVEVDESVHFHNLYARAIETVSRMRQKLASSNNATRAAQELFDFSKPGAFAVRNFVPEELRLRVLNEVKNSGKFLPIQRDYGKALQEMEVFYIGETDEWHKVDGDFPALRELNAFYEEFHEQLGKEANFAPGKTNSIGIHHYPAGSIGLTPHLDHSCYANVIASISLCGNAPWYVSENRSGDDPHFVDAGPGNLVLLRAPRSKEENQYRPFHAVGSVEEERYAVIFRQKY